METLVEIHPVVRTTQRQTNKKSLEQIDTSQIEQISHVFNSVKSQLHARLVTNVVDIVKKNEKFRRMTNRCFEHIPIMALCMDSNISEHTHLFDELEQQLTSKFQSIIIKFDNPDQYSSLHNMLKTTRNQLNQFYPEKESDNKNIYFQLSQFVSNYNQLKESEKRSLIFIIPEFETMNIAIFENLITTLSLQIKSISISFVLGLSGGQHSLQRLTSSRIASKLSIDSIYDSSARKYYEYIIKSLFLTENQFSITAEQLHFIDTGYFETYSLAWLEHALKVIVFSQVNPPESPSLNLCLFNGIYVSCNHLPNYPLGRFRSSFYQLYLSQTSFMNDLTLSINSSTTHQLDTCLNSFLEHQCNDNVQCKKFRQLAKQIFVEQQQESVEEAQLLRSIGDRKLNRYREQVFIWLKQISDSFCLTAKPSTSKINENFLKEKLIPMTREMFIRELNETTHWKQRQTPDLAILYRIYAESGTKIPLSDWFESFASLVEEQEIIDDNQEKTILARFVHGLAELDYLGFTKTSLQRSYHATKLTWDS